MHFIAKCPVLSRIRVKWFKTEFEAFLSLARDWLCLGKYMQDTWNYSWTLVNEFNL